MTEYSDLLESSTLYESSPPDTERFSYEELAIKQFQIIVEGLQIEYKGRVNGLVDLCSDSRFIKAKNELLILLGSVRANEIFHNLFS